MRKMTTSLIVIIALLSSSCQAEEKPKLASKESSRGLEGILQNAKWTMAGSELRTSLQEYIKQTYPGWETKREMIQFSKDWFYVVVVYITANKQRKSVTVASSRIKDISQS